ncbi:MAG: helix-turn-helix domain-containing protein [Candidatus Heimdallarchaeota archaeon]
MTLKRESGFWPKIISGSWVICPPIIIDEEFIKISIIIKDKFEDIYKKWSKIIDKIEVISINNLHNVPEQLDLQTRQVLRNTHPYPYFPIKQHEIALFATRKGYYKSPKKISAEELAAHFNISISAVNEHLRKAEKTAMHYLFS